MTFRKMTRPLEALLAEGKAELFTLDPELSGEGGVTAVEHRHPTCQPPENETYHLGSSRSIRLGPTKRVMPSNKAPFLFDIIQLLYIL